MRSCRRHVALARPRPSQEAVAESSSPRIPSGSDRVAGQLPPAGSRSGVPGMEREGSTCGATDEGREEGAGGLMSPSSPQVPAAQTTPKLRAAMAAGMNFCMVNSSTGPLSAAVLRRGKPHARGHHSRRWPFVAMAARPAISSAARGGSPINSRNSGCVRAIPPAGTSIAHCRPRHPADDMPWTYIRCASRWLAIKLRRWPFWTTSRPVGRTFTSPRSAGIWSAAPLRPVQRGDEPVARHGAVL